MRHMVTIGMAGVFLLYLCSSFVSNVCRLDISFRHGRTRPATRVHEAVYRCIAIRLESRPEVASVVGRQPLSPALRPKSSTRLARARVALAYDIWLESLPVPLQDLRQMIPRAGASGK